MWGTGIDITRFGSGNPGFNNVLRYSKWRAALCLLGDAGKGLAAVWLLSTAAEGLLMRWGCGMAAIAGHCFTPFLRFQGGKGIATAAGVMLYLYPSDLLPCVLLYILLRVIGAKLAWAERGMIASMSASVLFVALLFWRHGVRPAALGAILLAFVAWRHKKNFQTLAAR